MGRHRVGSHLRRATGSEKLRVASQYLHRTSANNFYIDDARKRRDDLRVLKSITALGQKMLNLKSPQELYNKLKNNK